MQTSGKKSRANSEPLLTYISTEISSRDLLETNLDLPGSNYHLAITKSKIA